MQLKENKKDNFQNDETIKKYINKNNNIEIDSIIQIEKYSSAIIIMLIIVTIVSVILDIISANIGGIVFDVISCIGSVSFISMVSRLLVNVACTAKKNQEIITKLLDALENNDQQKISVINNEIKENDIKDEILQQNDVHTNTSNQDQQQCPICYSWFSKESTICPKCGYDTQHPQSMERYMSNKANENECPNCFAKISPEDTECPNCGYKLK